MKAPEGDMLSKSARLDRLDLQAGQGVVLPVLGGADDAVAVGSPSAQQAALVDEGVADLPDVFGGAGVSCLCLLETGLGGLRLSLVPYRPTGQSSQI